MSTLSAHSSSCFSYLLLTVSSLGASNQLFSFNLQRTESCPNHQPLRSLISFPQNTKPTGSEGGDPEEPATAHQELPWTWAVYFPVKYLLWGKQSIRTTFYSIWCVRILTNFIFSICILYYWLQCTFEVVGVFSS